MSNQDCGHWFEHHFQYITVYQKRLNLNFGYDEKIIPEKYSKYAWDTVSSYNQNGY